MHYTLYHATQYNSLSQYPPPYTPPVLSNTSLPPLGPALPPRYPLPDCTRCWYAGLVPPLQCCALVQYAGGAIYVDGTITLSDCTFNKNTAVRNQ